MVRSRRFVGRWLVVTSVRTGADADDLERAERGGEIVIARDGSQSRAWAYAVPACVSGSALSAAAASDSVVIGLGGAGRAVRDREQRGQMRSRSSCSASENSGPAKQ